tara:strand:- start:352 stop:1416 length:1065 start_codon:yes stop_codon:yes gene_type:complete
MLFPYAETRTNLSMASSYIPDSVVVYTKNIGLEAGEFLISIETESPTINIITGPSETLWLNHLEQDTIVFYLDITENYPSSGIISLKINSQNGMYSKSKEISFTYGETYTVFAEEGNSINQWYSESWGVDFTNFYSSEGSITDSPTGSYESNQTSTIELTESVNLQDQINATLTFFTKWDIESGWDFAQLNISIDDGLTWTPLCGRHTKQGNQYQDYGQPIYDGSKNEWIQESIDLNPYLGEEIKLQFRIVSDGAIEGDGFYFDDLKIYSTFALEVVESKKLFNLYPNPSQAELNFNFFNKASGLLKIYSVLGEEIYQTEVENKKHLRIDASGLPRGVYLIKFNNTNKIWIKND